MVEKWEEEEEDLELGATPDPGAGGRLTRAPVRDQPEGRVDCILSPKSTST